MKFLKKYNESKENKFFKTEIQVENWLNSMNVENYIIHDNLIVDVNGSVDISGRNLSYLPVQFGIVYNNFYAYNNSLSSLEGFPYKIYGKLSCQENMINSLKFCPNQIGGKIDFSENFILSLKGFPKVIRNNSENILSFFENPIELLLILTSKANYLKFIKYLNDYDVIEGNKIILNRLREALYMIDDDSTFPYEKLYSKNISQFYSISE